MAKTQKANAKTGSRSEIVQQIKTPLSFYVLALLILEGSLAAVLTCSKLTEEHIWAGFKMMVYLFIGIILLVTFFVFLKPEILLFEKEQYLPPELDPLALRDQIEDLIYQNVSPECLQKSENRRK
jgi:hypothetical protein